jgi:hypothetical protein
LIHHLVLQKVTIPRFTTLNQLAAALQTFGLQLVSGGGAGAISKTCVAPIERIKVALATGSSHADAA